jgi:PAS domain S-box-containing protein
MKRNSITREAGAGAGAGLRRRAEERLRARSLRSKDGHPKPEADTQRLLHELQVHQVELQMQNAELQESRDRMETLVEKYTDLYDSAPVGYFSLDREGRILETNLTGAALLGVERSRAMNRLLPQFMVAASQPVFLTFLKRVFAGTREQACEAELLKEGGAAFWANFHGVSAIVSSGERESCRVAVSDITTLKQAEEAERRAASLADTNRGLNQEIARRQKVERALQKSKEHQSRLLDQSRHMQERLRRLSHQVLHAQEEERKRISRELHDEIAQSLVGINVQLAALTREAAGDPKGLQRNVARAQRLVERSVARVHRFARLLRPTVLDDLGLIPALHAFLKEFARRTGIRPSLTVFAGVEQLDTDKRTVLFRVAQEALANVAKHSKASRVELTIEKRGACVCMKLKDDGGAFEVDRVLQEKGSKRLGLLGMRERLEMVGGSFEIESAPGRGTTVRAQIPFGKGRVRVRADSGAARGKGRLR